MSWSIHLTPWLFVDQQYEPTDDNLPDEDALQQCGGAAMEQVIYNKTGKTIHADTIKDAILGQNKTGIIYSWQMVDFLNGKYPAIFNQNLGARVITPQYTSPINATNSLLYWEWDFLTTGNPVIGLFWWNAPNTYDSTGEPIYHWRCINGMDDNYVYSPDTLRETGDTVQGGGYMRVENYQNHQAMSRQLIITVGTPKY